MGATSHISVGLTTGFESVEEDLETKVERRLDGGAALPAMFADMLSHNDSKSPCDASPSQSIKSTLCRRRNSSGRLTASIRTGTRTFRSAAAAASFLTHSEEIECLDHRTTTLLAVPSSSS